MTHYDTDIIAYNSVIIVTRFADAAVQILVPTVTGTVVTVTVTVALAKTQLPVTQAGSELELEE